MSRRRLRITDHALLRFIERVGGLDVDRLREQLLASLQRAECAAADLGAREYAVVADGNKYIVVNSTVVTVLGVDMRHKRIKKRQP